MHSMRDPSFSVDHDSVTHLGLMSQSPVHVLMIPPCQIICHFASLTDLKIISGLIDLKKKKGNNDGWINPPG